MGVRRIQAKQLISTLRNKHGSDLSSPANRDIVELLLQSMGIPYSNKQAALTIIDGLIEKGVLLRESDPRNGRMVRLAIVADVQQTANNGGAETEKIGDDVPLDRKRIRGTTYARDGQGNDLPPNLRDDQCGPVKARNVNPQVDKELRELAAQAAGALSPYAGRSMTREAVVDILAKLMRDVMPHYDNADIELMGGPLIGRLMDEKTLKRQTTKGVTTYTVDLPGDPKATPRSLQATVPASASVTMTTAPTSKPQQAATPASSAVAPSGDKTSASAAVRALLERAAAQEARITELTGENQTLREKAKSSGVDPAVLRQATERLRQFDETIKELQRELAEKDAAHEEEIRLLKKKNEAEVAKLTAKNEQDLEEALATIEDLEEQIKQLKEGFDPIDGETMAELQKYLKP